MSDWTRQEVIQLCGMTRGQFEILERRGLLERINIGNPKRPTVMFTNDQLLCLRACGKLREKFTFQLLKDSLHEFLNTSKPQPNQRLLAWEKKLMWIDDNPEKVYEAIVNGENNGNLLMTFTVKDLVDDLINDGAEVTDFKNRLATA